MLAALNRYLKEHGHKYSIIRDQEFHQSKLVLEGKVVSPTTRERQKTQCHERIDNWGRRSAMEWTKSWWLQPKRSSFPDDVVDLDSTFWPEGKTGASFNGSRGLQFLCRWQWHRVHHLQRRDREDLTQNIEVFCQKCSLLVVRDVPLSCWSNTSVNVPKSYEKKVLFTLP